MNSVKRVQKCNPAVGYLNVTRLFLEVKPRFRHGLVYISPIKSQGHMRPCVKL